MPIRGPTSRRVSTSADNFPVRRLNAGAAVPAAIHLTGLFATWPLALRAMRHAHVVYGLWPPAPAFAAMTKTLNPTLTPPCAVSRAEKRSPQRGNREACLRPERYIAQAEFRPARCGRASQGSPKAQPWGRDFRRNAFDAHHPWRAPFGRAAHVLFRCPPKWCRLSP